MKLKLILLATLLTTSCSFFDRSSEIVGDYTFGYIDSRCEMTIFYGPIWQMDGQIYAIGWDEDFIIAKRNPDCNKSITDYFIIDIAKNSVGSEDSFLGVFGPFTENEFILKREYFGVPQTMSFTLEP